MTAPRTWRDQAACRDEDGDLFYPRGESALYHQQVDQATAICRGCEAIHACFAWAIDTGQEHGIWGGTTETDRKNYRRRRRENARKNGATA